MDGSRADASTAKTKGEGGFLTNSIRALQQTASSSSSSPSRKPAHTYDSAAAGAGQHRRQPTGDSPAVQICPEDEEEIYTSADTDARNNLLFAPRHRRTITPMGGGAKVVVGSGTGTGSSETATSSMQVLRSAAATVASSSQSESSGTSRRSKTKKKKNQKKKATKTIFAMDETQPLPRLGNDPTKNSVRNISTEVLADEGQESQKGGEAAAQAERSGYYDSLTLSRNDFASTSYFGGVLARDDREGEFRSTATADAGGNQASIFRTMSKKRSSRAVGQHCSDFDIGTTPTLPVPNGDDHTIRQAGSFDTLVSRFSRNRSLLSSDDDNHTHRSFITTASITTVRHSNKNKAKQGTGGNENMEPRTIASRVKPIDEDDGSTDDDRNGSSSKRIPKVLRQTGTIIKRALRDVKASRGRLGSEPGIQWDLDDNVGSGGDAFASARARIQSADVYYAHQLHHDAKTIEVEALILSGRRISI